MIESTDVQGIATTRTITFSRGDTSVTVSGVPVTIRADGNWYVDGPLSERIDDAAQALLAIVREAREATASVIAGKPGEERTNRSVPDAARQG